jgi:hypothetical protein
MFFINILFLSYFNFDFLFPKLQGWLTDTWLDTLPLAGAHERKEFTNQMYIFLYLPPLNYMKI